MAKTKKATKKPASKKSAKKPANKPAKKKSSTKAAKTAKGKPKATAKANAKPKAALAKAKAAAKPAKIANEAPTDVAARLGRKSGEIMVLDGENTSPDDTTLQDWAYDWFLNAGGFDAIKGSDDGDPAQQAAIKQSFFDAFKTAIRMRLNLAQPNALG
jgi:hypothetical protein